jgi:hypothetical protein
MAAAAIRVLGPDIPAKRRLRTNDSECHQRPNERHPPKIYRPLRKFQASAKRPEFFRQLRALAVQWARSSRGPRSPRRAHTRRGRTPRPAPATRADYIFTRRVRAELGTCGYSVDLAILAIPARARRRGRRGRGIDAQGAQPRMQMPLVAIPVFARLAVRAPGNLARVNLPPRSRGMRVAFARL